MALPFPPPIAFDLDARERAIVEKAYRFEVFGGRLSVVYSLLLFSSLLQAIGPAVRLYRLHGNDPGSWVVLIFALVLGVLVLASIVLRSSNARFFVMAQGATVVTFETSGLSIERTQRGVRTIRRLPFTRIRSVRFMPQAIVIATRWQRLLILPRAALPDSGAELMAFFDDRLTGKRMLRRSSSNNMTITNTVSPER